MMCTQYKYENLVCGTFIVWKLNNQISVQSRSNITPWHGCWYEIDDWEIHMTFSHKFSHDGEEPLKTTRLFKIDTDHWQGWDYVGREIFMKKQSEMEWDNERKAWKCKTLSSGPITLRQFLS